VSSVIAADEAGLGFEFGALIAVRDTPKDGLDEISGAGNANELTAIFQCSSPQCASSTHSGKF
jgi:hypothetical protein